MTLLRTLLHINRTAGITELGVQLVGENHGSMLVWRLPVNPN